MISTEMTQSLVRAIVTQQQMIIGPLAVVQANKVNGLKISEDIRNVTVSGKFTDVLTDLVKQYEQLFGQASVEVCKDAMRELHIKIPLEDLPEILQ